MENNNYRFVGVINFFGIYPDFVCPVFKRNDKYYFQKLNNGIITDFKEIKEKLYIAMIRFLDLSKYNNINISHCAGSDQIVAFQIDKNNFYIDYMDNATLFMQNFDTDDNILKEEIDIFLDKVHRKNNPIKIKEKILN